MFVATVAYAANLLNRDEDTDPTSDDMMYCVNDPGGTPRDRKCTVGNVTKGMTSTDLIDTADLMYDAEADNTYLRAYIHSFNPAPGHNKNGQIILFVGGQIFIGAIK